MGRVPHFLYLETHLIDTSQFLPGISTSSTQASEFCASVRLAKCFEAPRASFSNNRPNSLMAHFFEMCVYYKR